MNDAYARMVSECRCTLERLKERTHFSDGDAAVMRQAVELRRAIRLLWTAHGQGASRGH